MAKTNKQTCNLFNHTLSTTESNEMMFSEKLISHNAEGSVRGVICVTNAAQSWMYATKRPNNRSQDSGWAVRESNTAPSELQVRNVTD